MVNTLGCSTVDSGRYPVGAQKKEISNSLPLSSASDGTLSGMSSQPRALAAPVYHYCITGIFPGTFISRKMTIVTFSRFLFSRPTHGCIDIKYRDNATKRSACWTCQCRRPFLCAECTCRTTNPNPQTCSGWYCHVRLYHSI